MLNQSSHTLSAISLVFLLFLFGCSGLQPLQNNPLQDNSSNLPHQPNPSSLPQLSPAELCNKISDSDIKNWCLASVNLDSSYCDKISNPANEQRKYKCYSFVAIEKRDPSICSKIQDPSSFQNCISLASRDVSQCELDPPQGFNYMKESCLSNWAALMNDERICEQAQYKGVCFLKVAVSNGRPELCEFADFGKDSCYFELAFSKSDPSLCNKITGDSSRQACTAIFSGDVLRCPPELQEICNQRIFLKKGDYTQCENIPNMSKDECLLFLALKDISKPYH